jgi:uncharacterized protein YdaU (DUF1376 family)
MPGKKFWVFGNRDFKMLMVKVAVENGFEKMIANWGLKNVIKEMKNEKEEREKRQKEAGRQDEKPMPQTKKDGSESSQKQDAEKMKEEQKPPDPPHRGPKMRI